jgi:futalosine hydrolase
VILVVAATALELEGLAAAGYETLECGIGPVEAAALTARGIAARRPDAIVHVGIAGGRGIEPPTLVIGSEAIYEDIGSAVPVVDRVVADPELVERAARALPDALVRPIGTTARVGSGRADVEAMEGFAVLRAAQLAAIPALELRAIANDPAEPDRSRWRFDVALAALREAVPRLLSALE